VTTDQVIARVLKLVAKEYGYTVDDLRGPARHRSLTFARAIAAFLLCDQVGLSQPEVGRILHRDHSTINYELSIVREAMLENNGKVVDRMTKLWRRASGVTG
jgi:chromosomal replication initiation ATPase DnaA